MISVAIDGPSGAGKSSLAKALSAELGFIYVDTGAMYRSIGLYGMRKGIDLHNQEAVAQLLEEVSIRLAFEEGSQHIYLNGEDVSQEIRKEEAGMAASAVASQPAVRKFLLDLQRNMAQNHNVLMDGRDIGTVILPNATVKIYLTASVQARAERRCRQLEEKGQRVDFETVKKDIEQRDWQDINRKTAPLKKAEDAFEVDTSNMTLEESFDAMLKLIRTQVALKEEGI